MQEPLVLDGDRLTCLDVISVAAGGRVEFSAQARQRIEAARRAGEQAASRGPVFGRTTGVGANRSQDVDREGVGHGLRLWRSHAPRVGRALEARHIRAMIAIRAN